MVLRSYNGLYRSFIHQNTQRPGKDKNLSLQWKRDCPVEADSKTTPNQLYLTYISRLLSVSSEIVPFISIPPYFHDVEEKTEDEKDNNSIKNFIHTRSI